jgi:hypothetical protein
MTEFSQEEIEVYKRVKAAKAKKENAIEPMEWSTVQCKYLLLYLSL